MGFRKEVRVFMQEMRERDSHVKALDKMVETLAEQNKDLMDRLMSKNFMEYGSYKDTKSDGLEVLSPYNPLLDVDLAGDVINFETKRKESDS